MRKAVSLVHLLYQQTHRCNQTTLLLPSIETEQLVTFSGNKSNLAAGIFDDALFGQISATALVNPGIFLGSDTVFADASFNLVLQRSQIYGDTTATNVYELLSSLPEGGAAMSGNPTPFRR